MKSQSATRISRQVIRAAAVSIAIAMLPVLATTPVASAEAPANAVTGLKLGSSGDAVRSLQQALVNQGVALAGGVDGVFGQGTLTALKKFQSAQGLNATGVVDAATALALGLSSSPFLGLTQGNQGENVKQLQTALIAQGIAVAGGADGSYGAGTTAAVKAFQTRLGYLATGTVNAATAAALGDVSAAAPAAPALTPANLPAATASPVRGEALVAGLQVGARGTGVQRIQEMLITAGVSVVGGADGVFGALTANAIKSFQNARGLAATGTVDQATLDALTAAAGGGTPAPASPVSPTIGLKYGSLGEPVKTVQSQLMAAGITVKGGADGVFGTNTTAAVKAFQQARGLAVSGSVDEATAAALAAPSSPSVAVSPLLGLKSGSLGAGVQQLQQALITAGVTVRGGADGIFGPATSEALKAFQTSQGMTASGVVDEATVAALAAPKPTAPTSPPAGAVGYPIYGEQGARVTALQQALIAAGITLRGGADGDFGSGTSAAIMTFQQNNGLAVTGKVNDATAAALGIAATNAPTGGVATSGVSIQVFPVQGRCGYTDTWHDTRGGGRLHLGVDVIAPAGNLAYAAVDGTITKLYVDAPGSLSGNGVRLSMDDGTYFFYAHFTEIAAGIGLGSKVKAGQILGTVGSTGDTVTPHLHFEVHPKGGAAVNPYPIIKAVDACGQTAPLPQG
ncbi:MAG TPA: peptidoglycan-binding protein [Ilumatobacter sp.]|nr:peptidoglycan-binding protein [Ilumatobacter sp.]